MPRPDTLVMLTRNLYLLFFWNGGQRIGVSLLLAFDETLFHQFTDCYAECAARLGLWAYEKVAAQVRQISPELPLIRKHRHDAKLPFWQVKPLAVKDDVLHFYDSKV